MSYFITTSIPYVNSKPHLGHAQEFVLADALARYYRQRKHDVGLQSGSDDNSTKNVLAAQATGLKVSDYVQIHAEKFQALLSRLQIQPEAFVRTSSAEHHQRVEEFLRRLAPQDVFEHDYEGLYCTGCEDFLRPEELQNGLCPDHLKAPELQQEKNLFFRLSRYQQTLHELIATEKIKITPAWRKKEVLNFIDSELKDISLSRSAARTLGWGIPYPGRSGQTVYVWIDALVNYWSAHWWREDVQKIHVIGKNVWKFHAIYWPALLLSANLPLPNEIVIHGFLTSQGVKISKSLGNGIDPFDILSKYGPDAFRFYLLAGLSWEQDADFSEEQLIAVHNSELANKWGNLISRLWALRTRAGLSIDPPSESSRPPSQIRFSEVASQAFALIHALNADIHERKPWEIRNAGELKISLERWFSDLEKAAFLLAPLLVNGDRKWQQIRSEDGTQMSPLYPRISNI